MVPRIAACLISGSMLLSGCASEPALLPEQLVDRAATCGVVAAIEARAAGTEVKAPLPLDAQEHILHYALLAGSTGESFSAETATSVVKRMTALQPEVTEDEWQELLPLCRKAFPEAWTFNVELPKDRFDSKLQCDELGKFISRSLQSQESDYAVRLNDYAAMARNLDQRLGPGLRVRAGADLEAQQEVRRQALAAAAKLGRPTPVLDKCVERYG